MPPNWWQRNRLTIVIATTIITLPCWGGCGVLLIRRVYIHEFVYTDQDRDFVRSREYSEGLPSVARRLKAEMEPIVDPDTAVQVHPNWVAIRFPNREWVFGHGVDSHGFTTGHGTLVIKDNQGRVRIFFGHVCGNNAQFDLGRTAKSLDEFYKTLLERDTTIREWKP